MKDNLKGDIPVDTGWYPEWLLYSDTVYTKDQKRNIIRLAGSFSTLKTLAGDDIVSIHSSAVNVYVDGGADNDFIGTSAIGVRNPTILGGAGNDTIRVMATNVYAEGGAGNDLFIPLNHDYSEATSATFSGGAGDDTFWFIEDSKVSISGGAGKNTYRFDPYDLFGPYHNEVIIKDISTSDVIRYDENTSNGKELSLTENGNDLILTEDYNELFSITLQGGANRKSEVAQVTYQAVNWRGTLGELFPELTIGGDDGGSDTTGGGGNDTIPPDPTPSTLISNYTNSVRLNGTSYSDSIRNYASNVTIDSGAGNDTIYTLEDRNIINSGAGDDYVYTWSGTTNVQINTGDGKDSVHVGSNGATVNSGAGDDFIHSYANNQKATINGGAGNDTLEMAGDSVVSYGDSGNDYFHVYANGYNQTVIGGAGNDSAFSAGENVFVDMGEGNDYVQLYNSAKKNTLTGGAGNDTMKIGGDTVIAYGGAGNDVIKSYSTLGTLYLYSSGDGNDSISGISANDTLKIENTTYSTVNSGSTLIITAGSGKITVDNGANVAFKIDGDTEDDDVISNSANNTVITGTSSADSISNSGTTVTISGGVGNDTIENYANNVTINGDAGNDMIYITSVSGNVINTGDGADTVWSEFSSNTTINFGAGNDYMDGYPRTNGDGMVVYGGAGNDYLYGQYRSKTYGDDGNDTITSVEIYSTIDGGAGNDSITCFYFYDSETYVSISGGVGNDTIIMLGGYNTINGGTGDDVIMSNTGYSFINGNDGNDSIYISGSNNTYNSNNTISGCAGNDYISLDSSAKSNVIKYSSGDGNDTIVGIDSNDTLQIEGTTYSTVESGSNLIIGAGSGSITVEGGANVGFKILGTLQGGTDEVITLNSAKTSATILPAYEDATFDAADYSKLVTIDATEATVDLKILGNAKNNKIYGSENNDTLYGGKGTDTLTGNGGADTFHIVKGEGNKVIADYTEGEDIIFVEGADVETVINSASIKSGNVVFKVGTNNLTVKGGDGQLITFLDESGDEYYYPPEPDTETVIFNAASTAATVTAYYEDATFDAADYSKLVTIDATEATVDLEILGNAKNNKIYGSENNDTLYGGEGTDTLTGNGGADTFQIVKGEGNKVIADYTEGEDIIFVEGADVETVIDSASIKSGNVIFKVGTNNLTVKGGDGQLITFLDEDGNEYTYPDEEKVIFNAASTSATITAYYEDSTFDAADYPKLVTINATEATVDLEILGNAKNNKIYGSENNDTLYGGKGTDTLTGNGGADTFHIVKGEGNKVIADYTEGEDIIFVEGADVETVINKASVKSGNVIFTVGTNKVTVKGGDGQEISFVDENGDEYIYGAAAKGRSALWFTEDDTNFISDTPQLDSISEPKYSVTEMQTTTLEIFAQDKQELPVIASDK